MKLHERLFVLFVAVLPIQLSKHGWPSWSFILGRRVDFLSPTLYLTDILLGATILLWLIEERDRLLKTVRSMRWKSIMPIVPLLILTIGNIALSGQHPETWVFWGKMWELAACILYIHSARPRLSRIITALSFAALYSSLLAILQFLVQHSLGGVVWWFGERTFSVETPGIARSVWCATASTCRLMLRPYATFPHPNVLGGFLSCVITLLVGYLAFGKRSYSLPTLWLYRTSLPISIIALAITFSRSAWISLSVSMALLCILSIWYRRKSRQMTLLLIMGISLFFMLMTVKVFPGMNDESVTIRQKLASHALELWRTSPLTGIGGNRFLPSLPSITYDRQPGFLQPAHSIYVMLLTEAGLMGLMAFLALPILILMRLMRLNNALPVPYVRLRHIFGIALFQILLVGLVDHYPMTLQQGQLLLILLLGVGLTRPSQT